MDHSNFNHWIIICLLITLAESLIKVHHHHHHPHHNIIQSVTKKIQNKNISIYCNNETNNNCSRKKRNSLGPNYPWDLTIYDNGDGFASGGYSSYGTGGGYGSGRFGSNNVAGFSSTNFNNNPPNLNNNNNNHQHHHHHHHQTTAAPSTNLIGPFGEAFNQLSHSSPYQTNRLDFNANPMFSPGHTPVFLVNSKNTGITNWIIPFLMMMALPFITGAAFIPLFLKSIVYLLQIGRNLGILFPLIPPVLNGTNVG